MRRTLGCTLLFALACDSADGGDAVSPALGSGKADAADHVTMHDALAFGADRDERFTEDLQFHGYPLAVREGAVVTLELTHAGSAAKLDATLFVYGPHTNAGWGTDAIAFDDDSGWGRLPRLRALELDDAGDYLVVVGTHDARGRGRFRMRAACESGECAPPTGCVFGTMLVELLENPRVAIESHVVLHAGDAIDALREAQIVDAVHESAHDDVTTAAEAFDRVDGGEINVYTLHDGVSGRRFTFIEFGAGDNSFGRVYDEGTTTVVVRDHDTDLLDCTVAG
ncbi:MAG: hypothetical protein K1X88_12910 [Nannocystaceae bacterium]|nr:hypothetical protein [Nannocystaceae bacterium]